MKACRAICNFSRSCARACQSIITNCLHTFHAFRHFSQFSRGAIAQPKAIAGTAVDEFSGTVPRMEVCLGGWFFLDEFFHFCFLKQIVPSVNGLVSDSDIWYITDWFAAAIDKIIVTVKKIGVDIICNIRCGVFSFLSAIKPAIDQYRLKQRVALFQTLGAAALSLKSASKNEVISNIEAKRQNTLQWYLQIKDEISPLLLEAQNLLNDFS